MCGWRGGDATIVLLSKNGKSLKNGSDDDIDQ
jgi:hypothetical protein